MYKVCSNLSIKTLKRVLSPDQFPESAPQISMLCHGVQFCEVRVKVSVRFNLTRQKYQEQDN